MSCVGEIEVARWGDQVMPTLHDDLGWGCGSSTTTEATMGGWCGIGLLRKPHPLLGREVVKDPWVTLGYVEG